MLAKIVTVSVRMMEDENVTGVPGLPTNQAEPHGPASQLKR